MSIIYGIDLGTSNCLVAELIGSNHQTKISCLPIEPTNNANSFKSVIHFEDSKTTIIGREAERKLIEAPEQTVELLKTRIGKDTEIEIHFPKNNQREIFSPQAISAIMLNHIHKKHPDRVKKAVLTVPADFDQNKKGITKQIGELSGIEIIELIEEPSAALMYYLYKEYKDKPKEFENYKKRPKNHLVFDFGGGTLDLSLIKVGFDENGHIRPRVLEKGGNMDLGGNTIDLKLTEYFLKEIFKVNFPNDSFIDEAIQELRHYEKTLRYRAESSEAIKEFLSGLKREAEKTKISLSDCEEDEEVEFSSPLYKYDEDLYIYRDEFEKEVLDKYFKNPVLETIGDILAQIDQKGHGPINKVILVGGSSRIPYFKKLLATHFPEIKDEFVPFEEYDTAIAKGAAIVGAIHAKTPVAPFALNRCYNIVGHDIILNHLGDEQVVIKRGTEFPFKKPVEIDFSIRHSLVTHIPMEIKEDYSQFKEVKTIKKAEFYHPFFYTNEKVSLSLEIDQHGLLRFSAVHKPTNEIVEFEAEKSYLLSDKELLETKELVKGIS